MSNDDNSAKLDEVLHNQDTDANELNREDKDMKDMLEKDVKE